MILLACLAPGFQGCGERAETPGEACEIFERALSAGAENECRRAKEKCLAAMDGTIKENTEQMHALLTALGADTEREKVLRPAITKLEKDLSELKTKRERFNAARCDKP
jgi:chromosome segregation ATPase